MDLRRAARVIEELDPDLVAIQEVDHLNRRNAAEQPENQGPSKQGEKRVHLPHADREDEACNRDEQESDDHARLRLAAEESPRRRAHHDLRERDRSGRP